MVPWDLFCSLEFIIVLFIWQPCDLFLEGSRVNFTWPCWVWIPLSSLSCCLISSLPHLACISCLWFLLWSVLISIWMPLTCFVRTEAGKKVEIESRACVEVNLFFCVSIRSNLPEDDIFASFSCLWNRPLGLTNTSQVGIKTQFGQGSCYVAIRNASKDPGGIRKSWAVVISKTPVPVSIPLLEQKRAGQKSADHFSPYFSGLGESTEHIWVSFEKSPADEVIWGLTHTTVYSASCVGLLTEVLFNTACQVLTNVTLILTHSPPSMMCFLLCVVVKVKKWISVDF